MSAQIFLKAVNKWWMMDQNMLIYQLLYLTPFIINPVIFLFAKSQKTDEYFDKKDIGWIVLLALVGIQFYFKLWITGDFYNERWWRAVFQLITLFYAFYRSYPLLRQNNWGLQFLKLTTLVQFVVILALSLSVEFQLANVWIQIMFLSLSVYPYWIGYSFMINRESFDHRKYLHSGLRYSEMPLMIQSIIETMEKKKLYKNPDLTLDGFSAMAGFSKNHVSQVLNGQLGTSFKDWTNKYRVQEASDLLLDQHYKCETIASIAFESGFNSLSHFNEVFKKQKGLTPSQYRSNLSKAV
ncbi:helix-turn-helix transcriptional regulator [bacterium]|nr:helix-turn-helix transcriptional regulator [bacterium]